MPTVLRALLLGLLSLAPLSGATPAASASPAPSVPARAADAPVTMKPFDVLAEQFELQVHIIEENGVRILDRIVVGPVTKNSLAARAGVREGMYVLSIYGVAVPNRPEREFIKDYVAHHDAAKLTLVVSRFIGGPRTIEIIWPPK